MDIVLYVPGMPVNGQTLARGRSLGGSESAGYYLAMELARRGHTVTVFSAIAADEAGHWEGVTWRPIGPASEEAPFGVEFEAYVSGTPCDLVIGQRAPGLFHRPTAAKVHLWWAHDLALRRHLPGFSRQVWNLNGVLCVSGFHAEQLAGVYGLPRERITVVPNGVDRALFAGASDPEAKRRGRRIVYSSRPERGLEHLVGMADGDDSIMEQLAQADPEITLHVCGYDNTAPELAGHYARLRERCRALPNVRWHGALSKPRLAELMRDAWLHIYPTTFEEVSCITVMEAQAAGTPVVTCPVAALPETLQDGGVHWVPLTGKGDAAAVDREAFTHAVLTLRDDPERWLRLHANALAKAPAYDWRHAADAVESAVDAAFSRQTDEPGRLARHLMRHSDIGALAAHLDAQPAQATPLVTRTRAELETCYGFLELGRSGTPVEAQQAAAALARHYAAYYAYEKERGVGFGPESLEAQPRFEAVARRLGGLPPGAQVLDYGCAHGHYTLNLAQRYPTVRFLGVDLVAANIEAAQRNLAATASSDGNEKSSLAERVTFRQGTVAELEPGLPFDAIVAGEVVEHVPDPAALVTALLRHLRPGGLLVGTTPYGPWEALGFVEHHPWRAHLHHLERADLQSLLGHLPAFTLEAVPAGASPWGEALGCWVWSARAPQDAPAQDAAPADPAACLRPAAGPALSTKLHRQRPKETLSVCMVVSAAAESLRRCLRTVAPLADELILGIDDPALATGPHPGGVKDADGSARRGDAWAVAEAFGASAFPLRSPLETGFAAARNATLALATGDWVLWIDDDEELLWPERLPKYLRDNAYDAYALAQHHFAVEPGGVIKTDYPCRLFRNRRGFAFYGAVHEHPEQGFNGGAGRVLMLPDVAICHNGYLTEAVRRERFARNLPLMRRDRAEHPERVLGRFLWIRDLTHLNRFEQERTGAVSPSMHARAEEAVELWRGLLAEGHTRLAVDALPYYSEATGLLAGQGIAFQAALGLHFAGLGDAGGPPPPVEGRFLHPSDIEALTQALLREKMATVQGKYV